MAIAQKGIPDDTPENTVMAISEILKEEAEKLGASFHVEDKSTCEGITVTIDLQLGTKSLRIFLSCIRNQYLSGYSGTIGEGWIFWENRPAGGVQNKPGSSSDRLTLEMYHNCPPYRWSIYPGAVQVGHTQPTDRFLEGISLRVTIRERLKA